MFLPERREALQVGLEGLWAQQGEVNEPVGSGSPGTWAGLGQSRGPPKPRAGLCCGSSARALQEGAHVRPGGGLEGREGGRPHPAGRFWICHRQNHRLRLHPRPRGGPGECGPPGWPCLPPCSGTHPLLSLRWDSSSLRAGCRDRDVAAPWQSWCHPLSLCEVPARLKCCLGC